MRRLWKRRLLPFIRALSVDTTHSLPLHNGRNCSPTVNSRKLSETQKKRVAFLGGYLCKMCGVVLPPDYQIDHIVPVALGGTSGYRNLQALCRSCHKRKTKEDMADIRFHKTESLLATTQKDTSITTGDAGTSSFTSKENGCGSGSNGPINDVAISFEHLNSVQKESVLHDINGRPVYVKAGPGTGKTAVLVERIVALVKHFHVPPRKICALTFTNKAAEEMRSRVCDLIEPALGKQLTVCTFHSMCLFLLRKYIHRISIPSIPQQVKSSYTQNFSVCNEKEGLKIIRRICKSLGSEWEPKRYQQYISAAKNEGVSTLSEFIDRCEDEQGTAEVFSAYQQHLLDNNMVDFDDMLLLIVRLLSSDCVVRSACQSQWQAVLVDEFQDTNPLQFEILRLLCSSDASSSAANGENNRDEEEVEVCTPTASVFVVGDADQSIYGFRGADPKNLETFVRVFRPKLYDLRENYRSAQGILNVAYKLISPNHHPPPRRQGR